MKVSFINIKGVENTYKTQSLNKYSNSKINKSNDRVELSETARYLSKVSESNVKIDDKKINEIKKRIESGTYNIDSKTIAKKILENIKGDIR